MKKFALCAGLLPCAFVWNMAIAQEQKEDPILLCVGNDSVPLSSFMKGYSQNLLQDEIGRLDREEMEDYLQMYIDFRLKVKAAEDEGADTMRLLQNELQQYRMQLARPYLMDTVLMQDLIDEACRNLHAVVNCKQIVLLLSKYASPEDTLAAYNQCMDIRKQILEGADFSEMALKYSAEYERYRSMGQPLTSTGLEGMTGYFTAFDMDYPFEKEAFTLPLGTVSMPIRTSQGYALVMPVDRRPSLGKMRAAHILVSYNPQDSLLDTPEKMHSRIQEAYDSLQAGMKFSDVVKKYSTDKATLAFGGDFGRFFTSNLLAPDVMAHLLRLKVGDYSEPFMTRFGWHILFLTYAEGVGDCSEEYNRIVRSIDEDPVRSALPFRSFIREKMSGCKYSWNNKVLAQVRSLLPDTLRKADIPSDSMSNPDLFSKTIFVYEGSPRSAWEFVDFLRRGLSGYTTIPEVDVWFDQRVSEFEVAIAMRYELLGMEDKYPEFKAVMEEYRDGVYLFDISNRFVWGKAVSDSAGLESYYQDHIKDYMQPERAQVWMVCFDNQDLAKNVARLLAKAGKKHWSSADLASALAKKFEEDVYLDSNAYARGENPFVDQVEWTVGAQSSMLTDTMSGGCAYVRVENIIEPVPFALDDIRGRVVADYQNYLNDAWVKELRSRYKVTVFQDVFDSIFQK